MGGHGSGLFPGTVGSSLGRDLLPKSESTIATNRFGKNHPATASGLRYHIEKGSGVGKNGISGCHRKDNFEKKLEAAGGKVVESKDILGIEGVESVTYVLPRKNREGKPTGEYKPKQFQKSVYDSSKISTDEYISRGIEAAANPTSIEGRKWTGIDSHNVQWNGYTNDAGEITTMYPID